MLIADRRFAVLIDADNISDRYIKIILDAISNDGEATYKRIYGDILCFGFDIIFKSFYAKVYKTDDFNGGLV